MRRARFALYFALGLFLVMLTTIVLLMVQTAPGRPNVPFMGTVIDPGSAAPIVYLPNRLFTCTDQNQQFRCQATLNDQPLQITFDQGKDYLYNLKNCRATFAGKAIDCQAGTGGYMTNRGVLSFYVLNSNLGLSVAQLQAMQRQYWVTNLVGTGAEGFIWIATLAFAAIGSLLAIGLNWLEENGLTRSFTSLSSGFILGLFTWYSLAGMPYETLTRWGIAVDTWDSLLPLGTIGVGIVVTVLTGFYLSGRTNTAIRGIMSLLMGFAIAVFAGFLMSMVSLMIPGGGWLRLPVMLIAGTATVILLLRNRGGATRLFSCGMSGLGAFVMLVGLFIHLALNLGFAD